MKKVILILILMIVGIVNVKAQSTLLEARRIATKISLDSGKTFEEWSDWSDCRISVIIDLDHNIMTIDSDKLQVYRLSNKVQYLENNNGFKVSALDLDNLRCVIYFLEWGDGKRTMEIRYLDFQVAYVLTIL